LGEKACGIGGKGEHTKGRLPKEARPPSSRSEEKKGKALDCSPKNLERKQLESPQNCCFRKTGRILKKEKRGECSPFSVFDPKKKRKVRKGGCVNGTWLIIQKSHHSLTRGREKSAGCRNNPPEGTMGKTGKHGKKSSGERDRSGSAANLGNFPPRCPRKCVNLKKAGGRMTEKTTRKSQIADEKSVK